MATIKLHTALQASNFSLKSFLGELAYRCVRSKQFYFERFSEFYLHVYAAA